MAALWPSGKPDTDTCATMRHWPKYSTPPFIHSFNVSICSLIHRFSFDVSCVEHKDLKRQSRTFESVNRSVSCDKRISLDGDPSVWGVRGQLSSSLKTNDLLLNEIIHCFDSSLLQERFGSCSTFCYEWCSWVTCSVIAGVLPGRLLECCTKQSSHISSCCSGYAASLRFSSTWRLNHPISVWPALPPEPQPPSKSNVFWSNSRRNKPLWFLSWVT